MRRYPSEILDHYQSGWEERRLREGVGRLERARSKTNLPRSASAPTWWLSDGNDSCSAGVTDATAMVDDVHKSAGAKAGHGLEFI